MSESLRNSRRTFKVSSALKNIIGKDLITDDYIAVFELIKNSYDANATEVKVSFNHGGREDSKPKLTIQDNGDGMNLDDLESKWLFVAYSAKREEKDYRDAASRVQAGAKGIGRFSCDKLGSRLTIYTKKRDDERTHILRINWDDFEQSAKTEFSDVSIEYDFVESNKIGTPSGTILEIPETREGWNREKLIKLRRDLAKLINPNKKYGKDGEEDNFSIFLHVPMEKGRDQEEEKRAVEQGKDIFDLVNGEVTNPLFDELIHRTVSIYAKIIDDGKYIETELRDKNTLIYRIKEENKFDYEDKKLNDVSVQLLYLDTNVRKHITRRLGSKDAVARYFGFVSLYKNGFRIYPFGEQGDDTLGIDYRYSQGYNRYLPTRSMIGRIEITDSSEEFKETSSRDGGLIKNDAYKQLEEFFYHALKKFEKYVVQINIRKNFPEVKDIDFSNQSEIKQKIAALLADLSSSKSMTIIDIQYDEQVLDILSQKSEESLQKIFENFEKIANETNNSDLLKEAKRAEKQLKEINLANKEMEIELSKAKEIASDSAKKIEEMEEDKDLREDQISRLKSMIDKDVENVLNLHHSILGDVAAIDQEIRPYIRGEKTISSDTNHELFTTLCIISDLAKRIRATAQFVVKTDFNLNTKEHVFDICNFMGEYIENVAPSIFKSSKINFFWYNKEDAIFEIETSQLEISMLLDNLIRNAKKAKAKNIHVSVSDVGKNFLEIKFGDDGKGIKPSIEESIFDIGYTTTSGTGLGLFHVRDILKEINGTICIEHSTEFSTCFKIRIEK